MRSLLHHPALVNNENAISALHSTQAMRNRNRRPAPLFNRFIQCFLDDSFRGRVES